jgi:hypothetical protein
MITFQTIKTKSMAIKLNNGFFETENYKNERIFNYPKPLEELVKVNSPLKRDGTQKLFSSYVESDLVKPSNTNVYTQEALKQAENRASFNEGMRLAKLEIQKILLEKEIIGLESYLMIRGKDNDTRDDEYKLEILKSNLNKINCLEKEYFIQKNESEGTFILKKKEIEKNLSDNERELNNQAEEVKLLLLETFDY